MQTPTSHQTLELLRSWAEKKHRGQWLLGTIFRVEGSAYRRPGAMMLICDTGETLGILSGGCLESDIVQQSRRFAANYNGTKSDSSDLQTSSKDRADSGWSASTNLHYDSSDNESELAQLGLGCGGVVDIVLSMLTEENNYLNLDRVLSALSSGDPVYFEQQLRLNPVAHSQREQPLQRPQQALETRTLVTTSVDRPPTQSRNDGHHTSVEKNIVGLIGSDPLKNRATLMDQDEHWRLVNHLARPPRLAIFGGGIDARPLVLMALQLGWQVTVFDSRPALARPEHFYQQSFSHNLKLDSAPLINKNAKNDNDSLRKIEPHDAAVVMYHSKLMDAEALNCLKSYSLRYCALLGPKHRRVEVLELANIDAEKLGFKLYSPAGFDIGADLPETIALSILAQCHAVLFDDSISSNANLENTTQK